MLMRLLAGGLLCLAASAVGAQMPMQPQKTEPLEFLSIEDVKKQIEAARGLPGPRIPTPEERRKVVAEVNGEPITTGELLQEVTNRFAGALEMPLLNQALMRMEAIRRGATITDEEFLAGVQMYLAQKKSIQNKQTLSELLQSGQLSWTTFDRMVRDQVKIQKVVRGDLKLKARAKEPFNPLLMQIWAGQQLRGKYVMEMDASKLPPGLLGSVKGSRPVGDLLADVAGGGFVVALEGEGATAKVGIAPADQSWPRYAAPNVPVDRIEPDGSRTKIPVVDVVRWMADPAHPAKEKRVVRTVRVAVDGGQPVVFPPTTIHRQNDSSGIKASAPLAEMLEAVSKQGFTRQEDGTYRKKKDGWPAYSLPKDAPAGVAELVEKTCGKPVTVAGCARIGERFELPDVPVTMYCNVDRDYILSFSYGKLQAIHYEEALKSLAKFKAVKLAFKGRGIKVDEAKVKAKIDAENKKYAHPLFNRKMILQAKGTTPFDEDRRIWVADGVDQIVGTAANEEALRKFYQENILHFAKAKVRAAHILIEAVDRSSGKEDWAKAEKRINEIAEELFAAPDPRREFPYLAQRYSMDPATAKKGGDLGEFPLRGQLARTFSEAAFALNPGDISAPVKSGYGYHLILCISRTPPDVQTHSFENAEVQKQLKQEFMTMRRDAWLEKNVYAGMQVKRLVESLFTEGK